MIASIGRLEGRGSFRDMDGSITGTLSLACIYIRLSSYIINDAECMTVSCHSSVVMVQLDIITTVILNELSAGSEVACSFRISFCSRLTS
jgi:hypothetical protein